MLVAWMPCLSTYSPVSPHALRHLTDPPHHAVYIVGGGHLEPELSSEPEEAHHRQAMTQMEEIASKDYPHIHGRARLPSGAPSKLEVCTASTRCPPTSSWLSPQPSPIPSACRPPFASRWHPATRPHHQPHCRHCCCLPVPPSDVSIAPPPPPPPPGQGRLKVHHASPRIPTLTVSTTGSGSVHIT